MKSSDFNMFLVGEMKAVDFGNSLSVEVEKYVSSLNRCGSLINLNYHEDAEIFLDTVKLFKLLSEVDSGMFSSAHLSYLCDCLTLSERVNFENEHIKDIVFMIADPEINGGLKTIDEIKEIIKDIQNF